MSESKITFGPHVRTSGSVPTDWSPPKEDIEKMKKVLFDKQDLTTFLQAIKEFANRDPGAIYIYVSPDTVTDLIRLVETMSEALEHVQCQCTFMERDSGHLVDCWNAPAREALLKCEEIVNEK